ncbi:hypothetical protein BCR34DRAFT_619730 [Clohesyomyces aquaticus]|uniref:LIM zinc-binding domain-containing protein n=1 Tax=Clohesyomyces aquaticus TaxID=1231657 RepID=A0A1Y1YEC1_9PLEO|nr:hypothetical protein BCR34DRAFT_619730 [Clohesyomyces aquaticus]
MDPLTITATVVKLSGTCLSTAKTLYHIRNTYKDAPMYIVSMCSETTVISASLSRLQSILLGTSALSDLLQSRPDLTFALDAALTGCMVIFSCLDDELSHITAKSSQKGDISWKSKARMVWNRDRLRELLEGLRGLQLSINLLLQLLQVFVNLLQHDGLSGNMICSDSLADLRKLVEEGRPALVDTVNRTQSLRSSHPAIDVAESIFSRDDQGSGIDPTEYTSSIISDREFDFDDLIVNSKVYRRAFIAANSGNQDNGPPLNNTTGHVTFSGGDLIDLSDSLTITRDTSELPLANATVLDLQGLTLAEELPAAIGKPSARDSIEESPVNTQQPTDSCSKGLQTGSPARWSAFPADALEIRANTQPSTTSLSKDIQTDEPIRNSRPSANDTAGLAIPNTSSKSSKKCYKCEAAIVTGKFVRALGAIHHFECFTCVDCNKIVAEKFFPLETSNHKEPLCETCYFRRRDLICFSCGLALRGTYITAAQSRKYHLEHFKCNAANCNHVFNAEETYFEHKDGIYCKKHYCALYVQICRGCFMPILTPYVETSKGYWHRECYLILQLWNAHLSHDSDTATHERQLTLGDLDEREWATYEMAMGNKEKERSRLYRTLSAFQKSVENQINKLVDAHQDARYFIATYAGIVVIFERLCKGMSAIDDEGLEEAGSPTYRLPQYFRYLTPVFVQFTEILAAQLHAQVDGNLGDITPQAEQLAKSARSLISSVLRGVLRSSSGALDVFLDTIASSERLDWTKRFDAARLQHLCFRSEDSCASCSSSVMDACYSTFDAEGGAFDGHIWHQKCLVCWKCDKVGAYDSAHLAKVDWKHARNGSDCCVFCGQPRSSSVRFVPVEDQLMHLLWVFLARFAVRVKIEWAEAFESASNSRSIESHTDRLSKIPEQEPPESQASLSSEENISRAPNS